MGRDGFAPKNHDDSCHPDLSYHSDYKQADRNEEDKFDTNTPVKVSGSESVDPDFVLLRASVDEDVSEWSRICRNESVVVYKKKTEGTPMIMIKAIATLEGFTKETVFTVIYDTAIRQRWDKLFHTFRVVEDDQEKQEAVLYYSIKAPFGISNRDFLQK